MTDQEKNKMWCSVWCGDGTVAITKKPDVHSPKCPYYEDQPNTGDVTDWEKEFDKKFGDFDTYEQISGCGDPEHCTPVYANSDDVKSFISKLLANQRQEIIRNIRNWTKGRQLTKDKLRNYLNSITEKEDL